MLLMALLSPHWIAQAQPERLAEPGSVWLTVQTEHFRITFPVGLEGLAQEAAVAAEDAYQYLRAELGYAPSAKTDIVLCDATDTAYRDLEIFQSKIILCVAQGELAERFNPKFPSWVQQSVFSQYAQLVSADFVFGFSEALRPVLGKIIIPNLKSQKLLAGLGEYFAEKALHTPPDTRTTMELFQGLSEHKSLSVEQQAAQGGTWFFRYLTERFGSQSIAEWHRLQANDLRANLSLGLWSDSERMWPRLTGKSLPQIVADFHEWFRALRFSQGEVQAPLREGRREMKPGEEREIRVKREIHKHSYLYGDLYRYDPQTRREMRLTQNARVSRAVLFPDGQKILMAQHRWGDQGPVLALFDLQTRQITTLKEFAVHDYFIDSFAISPDGEQIALSIWRRGGFQDIYLMTLPLGLFTPITRDRATDLSPTFSPDGNFVLFSSDRDGVFQLYGYRLTDGSFFQVTDPLDSSSWKPVQIEPEPFPPWDGFPDTEYPITAYDPRPSLEPKLVVPLPGLHSLGLLTFGSDALGQHLYSILLGFNGQTLQPSYRVSYQNRVFLASLEALLERDGSAAQQSVTATLPVITQLNTRQSLALFYRRAEGELISHQIGLEWRGGVKVLENWLELSLQAVTQTRTGQRVWENSLGWYVGVRADLTKNLRGRIFVQEQGQLGAEFELLKLVRLGLLWDSQQNGIKFYLR